MREFLRDLAERNGVARCRDLLTLCTWGMVVTGLNGDKVLQASFSRYFRGLGRILAERGFRPWEHSGEDPLPEAAQAAFTDLVGRLQAGEPEMLTPGDVHHPDAT